MRALILGASGAVGRVIVEALQAQGVTVIRGGRSASAELVVDPAGPGAVVSAAISAADVTVVVNASGVEDPGLVQAVTRTGSAFVEISATNAYLAGIAGDRFDAPVLLGVGLAPGLTNLLAQDVAAWSAPGEPIDIGIILGAGDAHGAAATAWTYGLLGQSFADPATGRLVRNYSEPRVFVLPDGRRRRLLRTDFADQHALTASLGRPVRTSFATDDACSTALLALLTRIPGSRRLPTGLHLPGSDRWLVIAETAAGRRAWGSGRGQSRATGLITAAAVSAVSKLPAGVHELSAVLDLDAVGALDGFTVTASALG